MQAIARSFIVFLKEFLKEQNATRDTVYFYIEKNLMQPEKVNGRYQFSEKDVADFEGIRQLREVGFSIEQIERLAEQRRTSKGTPEHFRLSLELVTEGIRRIEAEEKIMAKQKEYLFLNKAELERRLKGSDMDGKND